MKTKCTKEVMFFESQYYTIPCHISPVLLQMIVRWSGHLAQTIDDCWDDTVHLSNHRFSEPNRWPFQRLWEYKYGLSKYRSPIININQTVSWLSYLYDRSSYTGKPTSLYWDTPRTPNQGPWRHHQGITVPCGNWHLPRIISHNWFLFSPRLRTELIRQPGRHMLVYAITCQLLRVG